MKRIFVLAAGGGYDILTIHLVAWRIKCENPKWCVDIGGMLNPKFCHFYLNNNGNIISETPILKINGLKCMRFRTSSSYFQTHNDYSYEYCRNTFQQKFFPDEKTATLSGMNTFHFALHYGTEQQIEFLSQYDSVYFCDVGGDILFSGKKNKEVKTPYIDAYSLVLAKKCIEIGIPCKLYIIAPGSDLELSPEHIKENLNIVNAYCDKIDKTNMKKLWQLYQQVRYGDGGHTIQRIYANVMIDSLSNESSPYGHLWSEIYECDIALAITLNPLAQADDFKGILEYGKILLNQM